MYDVVLNYGNLAPLFVLDKSLEETPDPFRLQGSKIAFTVPFEEYKKFIKHCLRDVDYLQTPTKILKELELTSDDKTLYKCYMRDMAVAVCKELHYAETAKGEATIIKHTSDAQLKYTLDEVVKKMLGSDNKDLRYCLDVKDFKLPKYFTSVNFDLWMYANMLYKTSYVNIEEWEVVI